MTRVYILTLLVLPLLTSPAFAQIDENFKDGDFTNDPAWIGNPSEWIVNNEGQLQSANTTADTSFYISTASTIATMTQWEFYVRLKFNTSSKNYVDVFLTASSSDLSDIATTGYFVRIGSSQDNVCLYRKDADGTITKIINGENGLTNSSDNILKIKITRGAGNLFILYRDVSVSKAGAFISIIKHQLQS